MNNFRGHGSLMTATQKFIARIEAFMKKHGMSRRRFGVEALNDPNFFYDLKAGRRTPTIETADKVDTYMDRYEQPKQRAKA